MPTTPSPPLESQSVPQWERGTPTQINNPSKSLLLSPLPLILILLISSAVSMICTNVDNADISPNEYYTNTGFGRYDAKTVVNRSNSTPDDVNEFESSFDFQNEVLLHQAYQFKTFIVSGILGGASVIVSNLYANFKVTNLVFGVGLFASFVLTNGFDAVQAALISCPFFVALLIPDGLVNALPRVSNKLQMSLLTLTNLVLIPLSLNFTNVSPIRPVFTIFILIMSSLSIISMVYSERHANGSLVKRTGSHLIFALSYFTTFYIIHTISLQNTTSTTTTLLQTYRDPTLTLFSTALGSVFTLLLCTYAQATSNAWHPVGSSQFQMVQWDSFSLLGYFILPLSVLVFKAWIKYDVSNILGGLCVKFSVSNNDPINVLFNLVIVMCVNVVIGMDVLDNGSLFGLNWIGKVYTCGQPHTGEVVVSVMLSDMTLVGDSVGVEKLVKECDEYESKLTIYVTIEELNAYSKHRDTILSLKAKGHHIGITSSPSPFTSSNEIRKDIQELHDAYASVLGGKPAWYMFAYGCRHPIALSMCNRLNVRVGYWSTLYNSKNTTSDDVKKDIKKMKGGNVVHVHGGDVVRNVKDVIEIVKGLGMKVIDVEQGVKDDLNLELD